MSWLAPGYAETKEEPAQLYALTFVVSFFFLSMRKSTTQDLRSSEKRENGGKATHLKKKHAPASLLGLSEETAWL